jgi:hypothetical protein
VPHRFFCSKKYLALQCNLCSNLHEETVTRRFFRREQAKTVLTKKRINSKTKAVSRNAAETQRKSLTKGRNLPYNETAIHDSRAFLIHDRLAIKNMMSNCGTGY